MLEVSKKCKISVKLCENSKIYSFFAVPMKKILTTILFSCFFASLITAQNKNATDFTARAQIALRTVGHHLMMANNDSTSLILPINKIDHKTFKLSFESNLSIAPDRIIDLIQKNIKAYHLPEHYRVQVIQCSNAEVVYSYEVARKKETAIVPCRWRTLPKACYTIHVSFVTVTAASATPSYLWAIIVIIVLLFFMIWLLLKRRRKNTVTLDDTNASITFGTFKFYPEEHKLIKQSEEIELSKKECELLAILLEKPNQTVTRDELSKRVWEDHGVVVGRSLDTYISKLRKKLKDDASVQITNIHGVGYKLVTNSTS